MRQYNEYSMLNKDFKVHIIIIDIFTTDIFYLFYVEYTVRTHYYIIS